MSYRPGIIAHQPLGLTDGMAPQETGAIVAAIVSRLGRRHSSLSDDVVIFFLVAAFGGISPC
jgi:hypothetical protein